MNIKIKQIVAILTILFIVTSNGFQHQQHNEKCGYDPNTGTGCTYDIEILPLSELDPHR